VSCPHPPACAPPRFAGPLPLPGERDIRANFPQIPLPRERVARLCFSKMKSNSRDWVRGTRNRQLPTANCQLPTANCQLCPICHIPSANFALWIKRLLASRCIIGTFLARTDSRPAHLYIKNRNLWLPNGKHALEQIRIVFAGGPAEACVLFKLFSKLRENTHYDEL
jgi:hypothetical protein